MKNIGSRSAYSKNNKNKPNKNKKDIPGEFSIFECERFKIKPLENPLSDIESHIGRLIKYKALYETYAKMIEKDRPYQHTIHRDGIKGVSEIISYHLSEGFMNKKVVDFNFGIIENLISVIVRKQLRSEFKPEPTASKMLRVEACFINPDMLPNWMCKTLQLNEGTTINSLLKEIHAFMKTYTILKLKISIKKFDEGDPYQVVLWMKVINNRAIGRKNVQGLFNHPYPEVTHD